MTTPVKEYEENFNKLVGMVNYLINLFTFAVLSEEKEIIDFINVDKFNDSTKNLFSLHHNLSPDQVMRIIPYTIVGIINAVKEGTISMMEEHGVCNTAFHQITSDVIVKLILNKDKDEFTDEDLNVFRARLTQDPDLDKQPRTIQEHIDDHQS